MATENKNIGAPFARKSTVCLRTASRPISSATSICSMLTWRPSSSINRGSGLLAKDHLRPQAEARMSQTFCCSFGRRSRVGSACREKRSETPVADRQAPAPGTIPDWGIYRLSGFITLTKYYKNNSKTTRYLKTQQTSFHPIQLSCRLGLLQGHENRPTTRLSNCYYLYKIIWHTICLITVKSGLMA